MIMTVIYKGEIRTQKEEKQIPFRRGEKLKRMNEQKRGKYSNNNKENKKKTHYDKNKQ